MPRQTRDALMQLLALLLALGVGILIGARACTPEPEIVERTVEAPAEVVYHCPEPDAGPAPDASAKTASAAPSKPTKKKTRDLPEDRGVGPADQRRKLLAWARDKASGLIGCRRGDATLGSVIVTFHVDETGAIEDVELSSPSSDDLDKRMLRCVQDRMRKWEPPVELIKGRREVVFGLDL